jgi:lipoprotein-anchoring transpeptidase ErfK/SrfK
VSGGSLVQVAAWVAGDALNYDDATWGQVPEGGYVYSGSLQVVIPKTPPAPPADHPAGKWIDVNLLHQTVVAYEETKPVHLAVASTGRPGWETPVGVHIIWRRVADETMDSTTLTSLGLDAAQLRQAHYKLQHVLDTQYFDGFGDALHDNYWLAADRFGTPHSHGCVGLPLAEASWFWSWANVGTPVLVRAR